MYAIAEEPLHADRLMASLSVNLPLGGNMITVEVPVSELTSTVSNLVPLDLIDDLLSDVTDVSQYIMDTAIITSTTDPDGTMALADGEYTIVCFVRGTMIETDKGPVSVEQLSVGDRIHTRDHGMQEIRWIGSTRLLAKTLEAHHNLRPIRIRSGAIGEKTPSADLLVSPQHRILVRSRIAQRMFGAMEVLVSAKQLCDLDGIDVAEDLTDVEYFHFLLDRHEVVYSNGAETASLYPGPQALKSVGHAAREEIFTLFPELRNPGFSSNPACALTPGRKGRKLVTRHRMNGKPLVATGLEAV